MMDDATKLTAARIAQFVTEHKGIDTVAIDVSEYCSWSDCFIVATVSSLGHLRGIMSQLWAFLAELHVEVRNRHKHALSDGWELVDCGDIIIHLMNAETREFYDLEKLWHGGEKLEYSSYVTSKSSSNA